MYTQRERERDGYVLYIYIYTYIHIHRYCFVHVGSTLQQEGRFDADSIVAQQLEKYSII